MESLYSLTSWWCIWAWSSCMLLVETGRSWMMRWASSINLWRFFTSCSYCSYWTTASWERWNITRWGWKSFGKTIITCEIYYWSPMGNDAASLPQGGRGWVPPTEVHWEDNSFILNDTVLSWYWFLCVPECFNINIPVWHLLEKFKHAVFPSIYEMLTLNVIEISWHWNNEESSTLFKALFLNTVFKIWIKHMQLISNMILSQIWQTDSLLRNPGMFT